jgi:hypothetical protein
MRYRFHKQRFVSMWKSFFYLPNFVGCDEFTGGNALVPG